jgi:hypothetical protein
MTTQILLFTEDTYGKLIFNTENESNLFSLDIIKQLFQEGHIRQLEKIAQRILN